MSKSWQRLAGLGLILAATLGVEAWVGTDSRLLGQQPAQKPMPAVPPPKLPVVRPPVGAIPGVAQAPVPEEKEKQFTDRVTFPRDYAANRKIEQVKEWIQREEWRDAAQLLQNILNAKEDVLLQDEQGRWMSVRFEANRILGAMPQDGLQVYELAYGGEARALLKKGLATGDPKLYADVALRYLHTEAGAEANALLGTYYLDQGAYILAALSFERLLMRPSVFEKLTPLTLAKAAFAFERAGDARNRDRVWNELARKVNNPGEKPLPPMLQRMDLDRLKALTVLKNGSRSARGRFDWPLFLGSVERSAQSDGGAPFLECRYKLPTAFEEKTKEFLERAVKDRTAVLSGFHPLAIGDKLVYRSYKGVHGVEIKTGSELWCAPTFVSLDELLHPDRIGRYDPQRNSITNWAGDFLRYAPQVFYDNSMLGTMSTDGDFVYFVEDLAIPQYPSFEGHRFPRSDSPAVSSDLQKWMNHNRLVALSLKREGATEWTLPEVGKESVDDPFTDTFFLGAPISLAGKLYVLAEAGNEIRLHCINPSNHGALEWSQALCCVDRKIAEDPIRRTQAAHLAYGDGVLVCPTNAGAVLGVDLLTKSLLWAHSYQEVTETPPPAAAPVPMNRFGGRVYGSQPLTQPGWTSSAPIISEGMVVFTAPDASSVHCLNLRDGTLAWKAARGNDLYLAGVYRGKVLLVGRDSCRALHLRDGTEAWKVETGVPSGRGVANAGTYFLPLKSAEVWAIDIDRGLVQGKSRSPRAEVPGNLIFHEGDVLSQTPLAVFAYPQLAVREREISESLARNPNDPKGLMERGELRLHQGDLQPAVADLQTALKGELAVDLKSRARAKLYEALGDLLERDFAGNERFLQEYQELSTITVSPNETDQEKAQRESEQVDRRARLLRLTAKGRESQGRVKEAFQAYLDFANLGRDELVALPDDPSTRALPKVWAKGRIESMIRKATPEQQKALDSALEEQWKQAEKAGTLESLQQFVNLFGTVSAQGRQARLVLAERLLENQQYPEAEGELHLLTRETEPLIAARSWDALARLKTRLGELEDAARCYRTLAQKYPKIVVRDGKTGEEIYLELATDKRFLPYVEELRRNWLGNRTIEARPGTGLHESPMAGGHYWLEPQGPEAQDFHRRYRLGVDNNNRQVRLVDRVTGAERVLFPLRPGIPLTIYIPKPAEYRFRPTYTLRSQILVFSWGHHAYAYDMRQRRSDPLWSVDLLGVPVPSSNASLQLLLNNSGGLDLVSNNSTAERVGGIVAVEPTCVCLMVRGEGLMAVDLLTGRKRWAKTDVVSSTDCFTDGLSLFMVPQGSNGQAAGRASAVRISDGMPISVPDFAELYQKRHRVIDGQILIKEETKDSLILQAHDVTAGKEAWRKAFTPQSFLVNSLVGELVGVVETQGRLIVLEARTGKTVLDAAIDPVASLPTEAHLLQDDSQLYLVFNQPEVFQPGNGRRDVHPPGLSLRSLPVHGRAYAFDRESGKEAWRQNVPPQRLIVDQFEGMPILLFACYQAQWSPGAPGQQTHLQNSAMLALNKFQGQVVYDQAIPRSNLQLHTLKLDMRTGQVDLLGYQFRMAFVVNPDRVASQVPGQ